LQAAAALDLAVEAAGHGDVLGGKIGLDLGTALDEDILARFDRPARVALNAYAALRAVAPVEEVIRPDHALGDRFRPRHRQALAGCGLRRAGWAKGRHRRHDRGGRLGWSDRHRWRRR